MDSVESWQPRRHYYLHCFWQLNSVWLPPPLPMTMMQLEREPGLTIAAPAGLTPVHAAIATELLLAADILIATVATPLTLALVLILFRKTAAADIQTEPRAASIKAPRTDTLILARQPALQDLLLYRAQFNILKDKLERLERKLDEVSFKLQQEGGRVNGITQALGPMSGDVTDLKGRVTMLENHSPNGQITNQVNTLNQQVSDIKKVINTIPGISI